MRTSSLETTQINTHRSGRALDKDPNPRWPVQYRGPISSICQSEASSFVPEASTSLPTTTLSLLHGAGFKQSE